MSETVMLEVDEALFERVPRLHGEDKLRCRVCGYTGFGPQVYFGIRYEWWGDRHRTHPWECSGCDRVFTTAGGLSRHRRAQHP